MKISGPIASQLRRDTRSIRRLRDGNLRPAQAAVHTLKLPRRRLLTTLPSGLIGFIAALHPAL
jgi:hypothetical protein